MVRWSWINTKYRFDCFAAYLRHLFEIFWWKHFIPFFIKEMKIFQVKLLQAPTGDLLQIYKMVLQHGFSSNYILGNWKQKQTFPFLEYYYGHNVCIQLDFNIIIDLFGLPIFRFWANLMKVIPEMRCHTKFDIYRFFLIQRVVIFRKKKKMFVFVFNFLICNWKKIHAVKPFYKFVVNPL
jgi:hypothetical protein